MEILSQFFKTSSRALSYFMGSVMIILALSVAITSWQPEKIAAWTFEMFGLSFVIFLTGLLLMTIFCWVRVLDAKSSYTVVFWNETGLHAANGIATLALTYTLFGISMGISTLSGQELNPETINKIINTLTRHFSVAFLTTIVGLPLSGFSRALLSISAARKTNHLNNK